MASRIRAPDAASLTMTHRQAAFVDWMVDVLVYIVVLNLFVEYAPEVIIESFALSILTAILLKVMLEIIERFEHRVVGFFRAREGAIYRVLGPIIVVVVLVAGKLLILEVVNWAFGDEVNLGHFFSVLVLIVAMIVAREVVQRIYERLGESGGAPSP